MDLPSLQRLFFSLFLIICAITTNVHSASLPQKRSMGGMRLGKRQESKDAPNKSVSSLCTAAKRVIVELNQEEMKQERKISISSASRQQLPYQLFQKDFADKSSNKRSMGGMRLGKRSVKPEEDGTNIQALRRSIEQLIVGLDIEQARHQKVLDVANKIMNLCNINDLSSHIEDLPPTTAMPKKKRFDLARILHQFGNHELN